jgi:hypothetical protein
LKITVKFANNDPLNLILCFGLNLFSCFGIDTVWLDMSEGDKQKIRDETLSEL